MELEPEQHPVKELLRNRATAECIDFIVKCLAIEPEDRLTPQAALHHKWIIQI